MTLETIRTIELDGVVIPTQWDRRGNVIQVAIQTESFEKYLIDDEKKENLLDMIDQNIHIKGAVVGEDAKGLQIIEINSVEQLTE